MCRTGQQPDPRGRDDEETANGAFAALLEDSAEDLYESAPCGYPSTLRDGTVRTGAGLILPIHPDVRSATRP
jgi:sigma-B regulation protein RsbU (phosphoserine phosphatase)